MLIVITDEGNIWNEKNEILKKYKDIIKVVCLSGKKVSEEFECFVCPEYPIGLGMDDIAGRNSRMLANLKSVAQELNQSLGYHDDILFLTDGSQQSLYPYYVLKNICEYNRLHLFAISPWDFENHRRMEAHRALMDDLSVLTSFLYLDTEEMLEHAKESKMTYQELLSELENRCSELLPWVIDGIQRIRWGKKYYFDFSSLSYVALEKGFDDIDLSNRDRKISNPKLVRSFSLLGMVISPKYPQDNERARGDAEQLVTRIDGKSICEYLKIQRKAIAKENGIPFETVDCPSIGPCAGTCANCDQEAFYLQQELEKIPEKDRKYPTFSLEDWGAML